MAKEWYCFIGGQVIGPHDDREIRDLAASGRLSPDDQVRRGTDGEWTSVLKGMKGLTFRAVPSPPPVDVGPQKAAPPPLPSQYVPPPGADEGPRYRYKMIQVPPNIEAKEKDHKGTEAAAYLESVVNRFAADGWEFYRVDPIGVKLMPGCLGVLLGQRETLVIYYVITFRQVV